MTLNLYISFSANDDLELTSNIAKIEECLHDLDKWMSLNKLKLNQTKTKLNFFTSTQSIALNGPYPTSFWIWYNPAVSIFLEISVSFLIVLCLSMSIIFETFPV